MRISDWSSDVCSSDLARYAGAELNQFAGAETIAARYEISREMLDRFGFESHRRAVQATASGAFEQELLPIVGVDAAGRPVMHDADEGVRSDVSRSEEHTSELPPLMRIPYAVLCPSKHQPP